MVNLLSRRTPGAPFSALVAEQRVRLQSRLIAAAALTPAARAELTARAHARFEAEFEELEREPSLEAALDLLDRFEPLRSEAVRECDREPSGRPDEETAERLAPAGGFVLYWPGRSLETGEADIASRGYFDALDRPPVANWLEAIGRRKSSEREEFEVAFVAFVPASDLSRAQAGCAACCSDALAFVDASLGALATQLRPLLAVAEGRSTRRGSSR